MQLTLSIVNSQGQTVFFDSGNDFVQIDRMNMPYQLGDRIVLTADQDEAELEMMLDAGILPSRVFLRGGRFEMPVPFDKSRRPLNPSAFLGNRIWGYVRAIPFEELYNYRNLAQNSHDLSNQGVLFPHASTNSGATDNRFMAQCAIDGVTQTCLHGDWPYSSWGINGKDDAELRIDFGRNVIASKLTLFLRADFPHDSWWSQIDVVLSSGETLTLFLEKSGKPQSFDLNNRRISWISLKNLVRGDDRPFPALSQIQVWGTNAR